MACIRDTSISENRKALDKSGTGTDEIEGADDVRTAREELKVLHEEKHKTEKLRGSVKKELETARSKTRRLEEVYLQVKTEYRAYMVALLRLF